MHDVDIEYFCAAVVHPDTRETVTQYKILANDPNNAELRETRQTAMGKEVGRLAQGDDKTRTKDKHCIFIMNHQQIAKVKPEGQKLT